MIDARKRTAVLLGLAGLVLIVLGIKAMPAWLAAADQAPDLSDKPALLFFNEDEPCECMLELAQSADRQMADWQDGRQEDIQMMRIGMEQRKDLEAKYKVFRAPCLVLVDQNDAVAWRQDYPLIKGGPFKLDELETAIATLSANQD